MAQLYENNIVTTLNEPGGVLAGDTVITLTSATGIPDPTTGEVTATLVRASDSAIEIVSVTGVAGNDVTIVRAQEGTTALALANGDTFAMRITAAMLDDMAKKSENQTFTKAQRGSITPLTDAASIATDMALNNFFSVTLAGNRTLANPTNIVAGQSGSIFITQDATGTRTLAYGSYWDFAGGTAPTLSIAANAVDRLDYVVRTATSIHAVLTRAWS